MLRIMLKKSIKNEQRRHLQHQNEMEQNFEDKIVTRNGLHADNSVGGNCCDNCGNTCSKPKLQSFQVYGKDDPAQIYVGENNKLLRVLAIGEKLKEHGHKFSYYVLDQDPVAFVCEPAVMRCVEDSNIGQFPLTMSNGQILKCGEYPDQEDFLSWSGVEIKDLDLQREAEILALVACETIRTIVCLNNDDCYSCRQCFLCEGAQPKTATDC